MRKYLPKLSGPYVVGCTDVVSSYGKSRSLFRLYYPTAHEYQISDDNAALWLPVPQYSYGYVDFLNLRILSRLFNWLLCDTRVQAIWNATFQKPKELEKLPFIIFSHGLGANRTTYSSICCDLASQGVLVASLEHADGSASATYYLEESKNDCTTRNAEKKWINYLHVEGGNPDEYAIRNRQVHERADDCCKLLKEIEKLNIGAADWLECGIDATLFKDALDLEKCAIVGHSFGAATALTTISQEKKFKVGVCLDAWMYPLDKDVYKNIGSAPLLFINSESFHSPASIANIRKFDSDTFDIDTERLILTLAGAVHQTQSDFPLLVDNKILGKLFSLRGTADSFLAHEVNDKLALAFIGKHLSLSFGQPVQNVLEAYKEAVYVGSNIEVNEEKIKASKISLRSSL